MDLNQVNRYWADVFGVTPDALDAPGVTVMPESEPQDSDGLYLLRRNRTLLLLCHPDRLASWRAQAARIDASIVDDHAALTSWVRQPIARMVGPAYIGYSDAASFRPVQQHARLLEPGDDAAYDAFRAQCPPLDWEHGGSEFHPGTLAGSFSNDGQLVALAGYELWGAHLAHIAIVSAPAGRGQGHGCAAVSRLTAHVLDQGLIPQYRTLRANRRSIAIASTLGYAAYADTISIHFAA